MIKSLRLATALLAFIFVGTASATTVSEFSQFSTQVVLFSGLSTSDLVFHQGDVVSYNMTIGSFIQGTMETSVKSVSKEAVVLIQKIEVMGQVQNCEETLNPITGVVTNTVCNGQQQNPGDPSGDVIESRQESVTVPAGTFDTIYTKIRNKKTNAENEQWTNQKLIPILGVVKMTATTQFGPMVIELTSFKKN